MSEERLLRSASRGDAVALEELVRALASDVYGYLAGMLGDEREADEAMQETFVRVARSLDRYDKRTGVAAWVFGVARRVAADRRPTPSASPGPLTEDPDGQKAWARRALRSLDLEHRELLVGREVLGWDDNTIATILDLPRETIPARLAVARHALHLKMGGDA